MVYQDYFFYFFFENGKREVDACKQRINTLEELAGIHLECTDKLRFGRKYKGSTCKQVLTQEGDASLGSV